MQPNVPLMHQVVTAQLAARRAGTQSTKTRAEVRGGGAKPFRRRAPATPARAPPAPRTSAAVAWPSGPKPRKYDQKTPKKMIKLALALGAVGSRRRRQGPRRRRLGLRPSRRPRQAVKALDRLGVDGAALVVRRRRRRHRRQVFLNLPDVQLIERRRAQRLRRAVQRLRRVHPGARSAPSPAARARPTEAPVTSARPATPTKHRRKRRAVEDAPTPTPTATRREFAADRRRLPKSTPTTEVREGVRDQGQRRLDALPRAGQPFYDAHRSPRCGSTTEEAAAGCRLLQGRPSRAEETQS